MKKEELLDLAHHLKALQTSLLGWMSLTRNVIGALDIAMDKLLNEVEREKSQHEHRSEGTKE